MIFLLPDHTKGGETHTQFWKGPQNCAVSSLFSTCTPVCPFQYGFSSPNLVKMVRYEQEVKPEGALQLQNLENIQGRQPSPQTEALKVAACHGLWKSHPHTEGSVNLDNQGSSAPESHV